MREKLDTWLNLVPGVSEEYPRIPIDDTRALRNLGLLAKWDLDNADPPFRFIRCPLID